MKRNNLFKTFILIIALTCSVPLFIACDDNDKEEFVQGDTTELKAELAACQLLVDTAVTSDYSQETIDIFKTKLATIKSALNSEKLSLQEVVNMTIHLNEAKARFLSAKMIGIPDSALIAGWNFDEEETSLSSIGTRSLIATLETGPTEIFTTTNKPQFVEDGINKALYFKNGAHLEIADYNPADFLGKQLSISVWLKPETIKGGNYIASLNYWNNWKFQIQEQGKAFFTITTTAGGTDADNEADLSVNPGSWKHIVVVLDLASNKLSFYINGLLTKEWNSTGKPNLAGNQAPAYSSSLGKQLPLMIGAATTYEEALAAWNWSGWNTPTSWDHFEGMMDEIKFYNTALESGQVQWLYNQEVVNIKQ